LVECNRVCDSVSGSYQLELTDGSGTLNAFVSRRILKLPRYTLCYVWRVSYWTLPQMRRVAKAPATAYHSKCFGPTCTWSIPIMALFVSLK